MDKEVFVKGIQSLMVEYGEIDREKANMYFEFLKDIPNGLFTSGIKNILMNYKYNNFPKMSVINEYCGFSVSSIAESAIYHLRMHSRTCGSSRSVNFADGVLNAVTNAVGWRVITYWTDDNWKYEQGRLVELYKSYYHSGVKEDHVIGYDEQTFGSKGVLSLPAPYVTEDNETLLSYNNNEDVAKQIGNTFAGFVKDVE